MDLPDDKAFVARSFLLQNSKGRLFAAGEVMSERFDWWSNKTNHLADYQIFFLK